MYPIYYWDTRKPLSYLRQHSPDYSDARQIVDDYSKFFDLPEYFAGDDLVCESNRNVWADMYGELEGKNWWSLGHNGILVRLSLLTKDQKDTLKGLKKYPLIDEDDYSNLEVETEQEQWRDWAKNDFVREIKKLAQKQLDELPIDIGQEEFELIEEMLDNASSDQLRRMFWKLCEENGRYPETEGDHMYYDWESIIGDFDIGQLQEYMGDETVD